MRFLKYIIFCLMPCVAFAQNTKCYFKQGGAEIHAASGCTVEVESGGILKLDAGSALTGSLPSKGVSFDPSVFESLAAGTSAQGDGPLTAGVFLHFVTGFDETKVVTLPVCAAANVGELHSIFNAVTNKFAKIFPASGAAINALSANTAYTDGATGVGGKVAQCYCQAVNQWYCA